MKTNKPLRSRRPLRAVTRLKARKGLQAKKRLQTTAKPRKPVLTPLKRLKEQANTLFSRAIRYRDGEKRHGIWYSQCITCGTWKPMAIMHAGHFQSRRYPATRWNDENVNAQCASCNMFGAGEQYLYALAIDIKYGTGTAKKLYNLAHTKNFKLTRTYLEEVIHDATEEIQFYEAQDASH